MKLLSENKRINDMFCCGLHMDVVQGYPYNHKWQVKTEYIASAVKRTSEVYKYVFGKSDILLIYDFHSYFSKESLEALHGWMKTYKIENIFEIEIDIEDEIGIRLKRYIFSLSSQNLESTKLFREIVKTDIGGKFDYASSIYILDKDMDVALYIYDDRGMELLANSRDILMKYYERLWW